jgi:hypothetical protein
VAIEVRSEQAAPRRLAAIRSVTTPQDLGRALEQWCASHGRRRAGVNWEVYGDPAKDPAQTRTDIYFLLEPAANR